MSDSIACVAARPAPIPLCDVPGLLEQIEEALATCPDLDLGLLRSWFAAKLLVLRTSLESHLDGDPADPCEWPAWTDAETWQVGPETSYMPA